MPFITIQTLPNDGPLIDVEITVSRFMQQAMQTEGKPVPPILACDFTGQGYDGLLGRDILSQGPFTFNGMAGIHLLGF